MNYGRIVSSFLVLAVSCNPAEERRRTYSFDGQHNNSNNHGSAHANSAPQLINFKPSVYPDLGVLSSSAPSDLVPNAPYFPDNNESGPTSPQTNKRSFSLENNYMTVETSASNEPRPGYYKPHSALDISNQQYKAAIDSCDTAYKELKQAADAAVSQEKEIISPQPTAGSTFTFPFKTEQQKRIKNLEQQIQPHVVAEQQKREQIVYITAQFLAIAEELKKTKNTLSGQKP